MDEETTHNIYNNGKVHVCATKCSTCVFRPGNLMHLNPGTVKQMVDATVENGDGSTIVCHDTLDKEQNAICKGWLDTKSGQDDIIVRMARSMNVIKEIEP